MTDPGTDPGTDAGTDPTDRPGPFPRHGVLRVNDLVAPTVDPDRIRAALAARGVPVGDRERWPGSGVRALVTTTAAGTVVTLERRATLLRPRRVVLRGLARRWDDLVHDLENDAPTPS